MFYIYYLIDPRTNLPFYVGFTKNEKTRLSRHIKEVNQFKKYGKCESNNTLKVGTIGQILESNNTPIFSIIDSTNDFDEIKKLEIEHISKFGLRILNTGSLTNMTLGGEGSLGKKKSKEELDRRTATRRERFNGVWHSEETKITMSESRKGYKTGKPSWNTGLNKDNNISLKMMSETKIGSIPWNKGLSKDDPRNKTGDKNSFYGKTHNTDTKDQMSIIALLRPKYKCLHCGKEATIGNFNRWHNDNCKKK